MSNCKCNNKIPSYFDASKFDPQPWEDAVAIIGINECGKPIVVDKPLYELTEEDREKLDHLIIDGDGNKYLTDDGTYKELDIRNEFILLQFYEDPANFVIQNAEKIKEIREILDAGEEPFVRIAYNQYIFPIQVGFSENFLYFEYDAVNYPIPGGSDLEYQRLKINIVLGTSTSVPTVVLYEVKIPTDADYIIQVDGDGQSALFNDGTYKATYTKEQVDNLISDIDGELANAVMYDANNDVKLRNNIVLKNDANLFGTTLTGGLINLIQCSRFTDEGHPIVDIGSSSSHITMNSIDRPNVQLFGESGNHLHQVAYLNEVEQAQSDVDNLTERVDDFEQVVNESIVNISESISNLDDRVTVNEGNIETNRINIENLTEAFNNRDKFRGFFQTTGEITSLPDPTVGDYAWNESTIANDGSQGSVWQYNGTTWEDTGRPIPNQAVEASDITPLVPNGTGEIGTSTKYMRADAVIPQDPTKADVADLDNYLPLIGNTQTTPITGDVWIASQNKVRLSNSGNTYLGISDSGSGLEIQGGGTEGINILTPTGTAKYNGVKIATVDLFDNYYTKEEVDNLIDNVDHSQYARLDGADFTGNVSVAGTLFYGASNIAGNEVVKKSYLNSYLNLADGGDIVGDTTYKGSELVNQDDIDNLTVAFNNSFVSKSGDSMSGDLVMNGANVVLQPDQSIRFSGNGAVRIEYVSANGQLEIETTNTDNGIDVRTNPSSLNSKFKYNGVEVATVDDIVSVNEVIDNLISTRTDAALSANQGRVLNNLIGDEAAARSNADTLLQQNIDAERSRALLAEAGLQTQIDNISGGGGNITVIDNLGSTSTTDALSANMGRVLNNLWSQTQGQIVTIQNDISTLQQDVADLQAGSITLNDSNSITYNSTLQNLNLRIAASDDVLTIDAAGVKANIAMVSEGSDIVLYGKNNTELGRVPIATGAVSGGYYDSATQEIVIELSDGTEIRIPAADLVDEYTAGDYLNLSADNEFSLDYDAVKDQLLVDGFMDLASAQTVTGEKSFYGITVAQMTLAGNITPLGDSVFSIGSASAKLNDIYSNNAHINNLYLSGNNKTAAINALTTTGDGTLFLANDGTYKFVDADIDLSNYVDRTTAQSVAGIKTFTSAPVVAGLTRGDASANIGASAARFLGVYGVTGDFTNLYVNGVNKTTAVNALTTTGNGQQFLANDGTYKTIDTSSLEARVAALEQELLGASAALATLESTAI